MLENEQPYCPAGAVGPGVLQPVPRDGHLAVVSPWICHDHSRFAHVASGEGFVGQCSRGRSPRVRRRLRCVSGDLPAHWRVPEHGRGERLRNAAPCTCVDARITSPRAPPPPLPQTSTSPGGTFAAAVCSTCVAGDNGCATCTAAVETPGKPTVSPSCATCLPGFYLDGGECRSCGGRPTCVEGDTCGCAVCGNDGVSCDTVAKGFYGPVRFGFTPGYVAAAAPLY